MGLQGLPGITGLTVKGEKGLPGTLIQMVDKIIFNHLYSLSRNKKLRKIWTFIILI